MKRINKYIIGIFTGLLFWGMKVFASEITPVNAILFSNEEAVVYAEADMTSVIVLPNLQEGLPIHVTGITNNGFFQIDMGGIYYVPGYGLEVGKEENVPAVVEESEKPEGVSEEIYSVKQNYNEYIARVVELVNVERQNAGLAPLAYDEQITYAATHRSYEMAASNYFSHTRPSGEICYTIFNEYNVSYWSAGENIAYGQRSPEEVMNGWMNSPGHRANILTAGFTKIGVGIAANANGRLYWTQLFTS